MQAGHVRPKLWTLSCRETLVVLLLYSVVSCSLPDISFLKGATSLLGNANSFVFFGIIAYFE